MRELFADGAPPLVRKRLLLRKVAGLVRQMHDARVMHRSLYPKHLFVRWDDGAEPEVAVIDLEKSRTTLIAAVRTENDLATLTRHSGPLEPQRSPLLPVALPRPAATDAVGTPALPLDRQAAQRKRRDQRRRPKTPVKTFDHLLDTLNAAAPADRPAIEALIRKTFQVTRAALVLDMTDFRSRSGAPASWHTSP